MSLIRCRGYALMDRAGRGILAALIMVLGLTVAAIVASLRIPYTVRAHAEITGITGPVVLDDGVDPPRSLAFAPHEQLPLRIGQTLRLDPGSTVALRFGLLEGRAVLNGPATFSLLSSERSATTLEHIRKQGDYRLEIVQTSGQALYYFDRAVVPLDQANIIIWADPSRTIALRPATPCWQVDLTGETPVLAPIDCP